MIRYSFVVYEAVGVSILCWVELHPPLCWLGWRVKADRDCSASWVGSRYHSPLECCLVRYSLNSHTNRWIASPLFFYVCQTLALHWIVLILRLQTSHSGKMDESDMLPCIEEHKSHFWCAPPSPTTLVLIILHSTHLCFAATANQNDLSHKSVQLQGRVSVIYFWWLA